MLTISEIETNKDMFISLLKDIKRADADIDGLINYLEDVGFFLAPATTKYFGSYEGGLCEHSLKVFDILKDLIDRYDFRVVDKEERFDSLLIVGLLHDVYKATYYEKYIKNTKKYSTLGKKYDEIGKYDWVSENAYRVKENNKEIIGSKGTTSFFKISNYIPLYKDEIIALIYQSAGMDREETVEDMHEVLGNNILTLLLHLADMLASYSHYPLPMFCSEMPLKETEELE